MCVRVCVCVCKMPLVRNDAGSGKAKINKSQLLSQRADKREMDAPGSQYNICDLRAGQSDGDADGWLSPAGACLLFPSMTRAFPARPYVSQCPSHEGVAVVLLCDTA